MLFCPFLILIRCASPSISQWCYNRVSLKPGTSEKEASIPYNARPHIRGHARRDALINAPHIFPQTKARKDSRPCRRTRWMRGVSRWSLAERHDGTCDDLADVLMVLLLVTLAGRRSVAAVSTWAADHKSMLRTRQGVRKGRVITVNTAQCSHDCPRRAGIGDGPHHRHDARHAGRSRARL